MDSKNITETTKVQITACQDKMFLTLLEVMYYPGNPLFCPYPAKLYGGQDSRWMNADDIIDACNRSKLQVVNKSSFIFADKLKY